MAVPVQDFIIGESNYQGLHRAANTMERKAERGRDYQRQQQARKAAGASFLSKYLDPKENLTGTVYDPQIVKGFDELLQDGIKMANEGADPNMMMMALAPGVAKLNQYSTAAKLVNQSMKDRLAQIPVNSGYDKSKLKELALKTAFYDEEGKLKDINTIDPNTDWLTETIKQFPDQVTTDAAIDEFVKSSPKFTNTQSVKRINARGGSELKKAKVTAPSWAVVDEEGEIVPRYDTALEGGKPHTFNFQTGEGKTKEAAIRLMNEKDFDALMGSNPGIADWVRGQVMKSGQGSNMNTPQAKNAARAIMYDELKRRSGGGIEEIEEIKENPAPRISLRVNSGGSGSAGTNINDVYDEVNKLTISNDKVKKGAGAPLNELSATAQGVILKYANELTGGTGGDKLTQADIYVRQMPDGIINIVNASDGQIIAPIDFKDVNLKTQPGIKEKRDVIEKSKAKTKPKNDPLGLF